MPGVSGRAFTNVATIGPEFPSLEIPLLGFMSALSVSSVQAKDFSPLEWGDVFALEQNF